MKKFSVLALVFVLTATMFAGCRRNPGTTGTTDGSTTGAPTTTSTAATTHAATTPDATTRPSGTGVLPDATDILPDMTDGTTGTDMGRSHRGPRY